MGNFTLLSQAFIPRFFFLQGALLISAVVSILDLGVDGSAFSYCLLTMKKKHSFLLLRYCSSTEADWLWCKVEVRLCLNFFLRLRGNNRESIQRKPWNQTVQVLSHGSLTCFPVLLLGAHPKSKWLGRKSSAARLQDVRKEQMSFADSAF